MLQIKEIDREEKRYFFDRIIYKEQFKGKGKINNTIFHIYNTYYHFVGGDENKMMRVMKKYMPDVKETTLEKLMEQVAKNFNAEKAPLFCYDNFTEIEKHLAPEEMFFMQGKKRRLVSLKEFKFILKTITQNIYTKSNFQSTLVNNYFLCEGFRKSYTAYTGKYLCRNKLTHILQVLQKLNFLHVTYSPTGSRLLQMGARHPFYVLAGVLEVSPMDVQTKDDRHIQKLISENKFLKSELHGRIEEVEEIKTELEQLREQVEMLTNILLEKEEQNYSYVEK